MEGERKRGRDGEAGRRRKEGRRKVGCEGQRLQTPVPGYHHKERESLHTALQLRHPCVVTTVSWGRDAVPPLPFAVVRLKRMLQAAEPR